MSANIEQIKAMLEHTGKTNLLQKQKVDLDKERLQLEATVNREPVSEDLEEAADEYSNQNEYMEVGFCDEPIYIGHKTEKAFIAGAEWQAEQLLKGSPMPEDTVIFQKGIEEGKRLMMEDAVEGEVCKDHIVTEKPFYFYQSRLIELPDNLKEGDKVKIVIVKEDGK